jgi:hypothetical protein
VPIGYISWIQVVCSVFYVDADADVEIGVLVMIDLLRRMTLSRVVMRMYVDSRGMKVYVRVLAYMGIA